MSQNAEQYHRETYARSLDVICVHNTTENDFIFWDDKYGQKSQRVMVPNRYKDIGKGKGNQYLPRYLAERYVKKMIVHLITEKSAKEWEKIKDQYRIDEQRKYEGQLALRTNNKAEWEALMPKLWLGLVEKYGGTHLPEPEDTVVIGDKDPLSYVSKSFDLENLEYTPNVEEKA